VTLKLRGLDRKASYRVRDLATGAEQTISGRALCDTGLRIECADRPGTANLVYSRAAPSR
jgi:hypothetical protein